MVQVHKKLLMSRFKTSLGGTSNMKLKEKCIQEILSIGKVKSLALLKGIVKTPNAFLSNIKPKPSNESEEAIIKKLMAKKKLIENQPVPMRKDNYSYIKYLLKSAYQQNVSLTTIIKRAKQNDFRLPKK